MNTPKQTVVSRPAETGTGLAGAVAILVSAAFGITDPTVYGAMIIVIAALPGLITWVVNLVRGRD